MNQTQTKTVKMYSTHSEQKSVVVERFVTILKNKIFKYMTSNLKNVLIDELLDIVNKYNDISTHNLKKFFDAKVKHIYWLW